MAQSGHPHLVMASSRADTSAFIRREMRKYAEAVKFSGAKVD